MRTILIYSLPLSAVFASTALISLYLLKFATDVLLIAPALVAAILLFARLWDAVSDPIIGYLSDRTDTQWGRRRPWFVGAALPMGLALVALWAPPRGLSTGTLSAWFAISIFLYYTAYTCFRIPHMAMGAELSRGYHDRTRVFGVVQAMESVGMFFGAFALFALERSANQRDFAFPVSMWIAIGVIALIWVSASRIRERQEFQGRGGTSVLASFRDVLSNPHSRLLIAIFFMERLGFLCVITLLPYVSDYIIGTAGNTALYAATAIGGVFLSIPFWVIVSKRKGKQPIWLISLILKIVLISLFFTLGEGDFVLLLIGGFIFGVLSGCGAVVGPSLKADVVDWDEARTKERKEGAYFATWNFADKAAGGVAIWIIGTMLAVVGYVPNAAQSPEAMMGLRLMSSALPAGLHVVAAILVFRFGLDELSLQAARQNQSSESA